MEAENGKVHLVTTNIPLDREVDSISQNGGVYLLTLNAQEENGGLADSSETEVTVILTDIDDEHPTFNQAFFNISIPENLERDTALPGLSIYVNDKDLHENSQYSLYIKNIRNAEDVFTVTPSHGEGRTAVVVRVARPEKLDYDVADAALKEFEFEIIAVSKNGDKQASTHVHIHLMDVNDNHPLFINRSIFNLQVSESAPVGQKIADIQATDKDSLTFGTVTYMIRGFGADYFATNLQSGGVYVKKPLDYEEQKSFILTLVAIDGGGKETNANLAIEILDENDNRPQFEQNDYSRTIREAATEFEPPLFVRATDIDGPNQGGGKIVYSIQSENSISGHVFKINSQTGELQITQPVSSMDTETGQYEIRVIAKDLGTPPLSNSTVVKIRVGITGNQRPVFRGHFNPQFENIPGPPTYRVKIPENAKQGTNVTSVQATDPDGVDSQLVYQIVGGSDNFVIDEHSGLITVSGVANLDRDNNSYSYAITVNAIDAGLPIPETATTTVHVLITDVNDKPPR